jgi:hypothetical protein
VKTKKTDANFANGEWSQSRVSKDNKEHWRVQEGKIQRREDIKRKSDWIVKNSLGSKST